MNAIVGALIPVVVALAIGAGLARTRLFPADAWPPLERLVYFVLFPCLIARSLATADFGGAPVIEMGAVLALAQASLAGLTLAAKPISGLSGPAFASVFQTQVRWNSFVALAVSAILFGPSGLALAAVAVGVMIPLANLFSVWGFVRWGNAPDGGRAGFARSMATNPLLIACAIGLLFHTLGGVPKWTSDTLDILGRATLALGLLAAGAGLDVRSAVRAGTTVIGWSVVRLLALPTLVALFCLILGVDGNARAVALICAATPTATSGYILAKQLGGDARLAAALITATTLLAIASMPAVMWFALL